MIASPVHLPERAIDEIAAENDCKDRDAPNKEQRLRHIFAWLVADDLAANQPRHDEAVADHDRERHGLDDHHCCRSRQAAEKGEDGEGSGAGMQRQVEDIHVRTGRRGRQRDKACHRDGNNEQIYQHEIEGKQPTGTADFVFRLVLDDRDVELPRQENDAHNRQERSRQPDASIQAAPEYRLQLSVGCQLVEETREASEHTKHDKQADGQECRELDEGFGSDGEHEAVLMLGSIDMPSAKEYGKYRQAQGGNECRVDRQA